MLAEWRERMKEFLLSRASAYRRKLGTDDIDARIILRDLAKFCRGRDSTAHTDPHMAARLDGRREVLLRIERHLHLSDEALWKYHQPNIMKEDSQ